MSAAPIKGKPLDKDALFAKMVKYYIEQKHYTVDHANAVDQKIVEDQMARRKSK